MADTELDAHGCVTNFDPTVDYYPPERRMMGGGAGILHHTATKAEDFSISYHKTYKVVRNLPASLTYILRHCGTPEELGFPDLPADAIGSPVFDVPVYKWSACGQKLVACDVIATPAAAIWPAVLNWTA